MSTIVNSHTEDVDVAIPYALTGCGRAILEIGRLLDQIEDESFLYFEGRDHDVWCCVHCDGAAPCEYDDHHLVRRPATGAFPHSGDCPIALARAAIDRSYGPSDGAAESEMEAAI